jgi:catechol 2,3-dioxygenase-like lactoylglutathione lyase family enzyme
VNEGPVRAFPGTIRQVGHIVPDIERAMVEWLTLGVGPWTLFSTTQSGGHFHGDPSDGVSTTMAFSFVGDLQIELIQADGPGYSVWHDARDRERFGPHHIAYWAEPDEYDTAVTAALAAGMTTEQDGDGNGMARFAYLTTTTGVLVELMELTDVSRWFMDDIATYCRQWDSTQPVIRR